MDPIVIVGTGLAGYTVAREFRRQDKKAPLVLVTAHGGDYYSKPALSNAIAQGHTPATLLLNTAEQMAKALRAEVLVRKPVAAINRSARRIRLEDGEISYSKLVLALGSRCNRPPIGGDAAGEILGVNSLDDYGVFRARLEGARRVVILGAGLVGCEMANDLAIGGHEPHMVEMAGQVLPRLLDGAQARHLAERLRGAGVRITLGARVARVDRAGPALRVSLEAGETLEADLVLGATGLVPQTELARAAGLATARAIVVDSFLRTSDADIHAIGDCAEVLGRWLPYTEPIRHAARAMAATLAGRPTEVVYPEMPVELKTPACPLVISPSIQVAA